MAVIKSSELSTAIAWESLRHWWSTRAGNREIAADAALRQRVYCRRLADNFGVHIQELEP